MSTDAFDRQEREEHRPRCRWLIKAAFGAVVVVLLVCGTLFGIWWFVGQPQAPAPLGANRQTNRLHAEFMAKEGYANRGPVFQALVLTYDDWRRLGSGPVLTEAQMVQAFGQPDLMVRDEANGNTSFVYFYNRFGQKDWAAYFFFDNGNLTIGWNGVTANPEAHAQMVPYAPPATTQGR